MEKANFTNVNIKILFLMPHGLQRILQKKLIKNPNSFNLKQYQKNKIK